MKGRMGGFAKSNKCYLLVFVLSLFLSVSFLALSSSSASADTSVTATATVHVGSACTFTSVLNTAHTATIPSGTNQSEIGKTTFTVVCNDNGGYSVYAIGYGNNEVGNTKLLATINGSLNSTYDINTGTNASGTPSSWAMKLTPSTNLTASNILNGYGSYSVVPTAYTKVATYIPSTTIANSSSFEATYRVNIASTQPAGNYNGKVRYVMVNPNTNVPNEPKTCSSNKICYWPNAGNEVVDSMGDQSITSSATSATLWASNFQRSGYGFAGWSDAYDYVANIGSESNPNAHIYGPNEDITFTAGQYSTAGLSLYAVWVKSEGPLQGWNGCNAMNVEEVTALTDLRDNDTYAVAKLVDDNCWMTENLRLDYDNLDNSAGALAQGYGGQFAGLPQPGSFNKYNSLYYYDTQNGAATINIGSTNGAFYRMPGYKTNSAVSLVTAYNQITYSNGNAYSWPAVIADTSYFQDDSVVYSTSICPSDWKVPYGGYGSESHGGNTSGGFYYLNYKLNNDSSNTSYAASKKIRSYPNNFIYSTSAGGSGSYWTSTSGSNFSDPNYECYNNECSYAFAFKSSEMSPAMCPGTGPYGWGSKRTYLPVRCVFGN